MALLYANPTLNETQIFINNWNFYIWFESYLIFLSHLFVQIVPLDCFLLSLTAPTYLLFSPKNRIITFIIPFLNFFQMTT